MVQNSPVMYWRLPEDTPAAIEIAEQLSCDLPERLTVDPLLPFNKCYENVGHQVKNVGGRICYGWKLCVNNVWFEAVHHSVWEREDGDKIDITSPSPNSNPSEHMTFAHDRGWVWGAGIMGGVPNRFFPRDGRYVEDVERLSNIHRRLLEVEIVLLKAAHNDGIDLSASRPLPARYRPLLAQKNQLAEMQRETRFKILGLE